MGNILRAGARYKTLAVLLTAVAHLGCSENPEDKPGGQSDPSAHVESLTWHSDIAPIVEAKCAGCHQDDGIGPFSMQEYGSVKPWAMAMADAVEHNRMPPFLAQETDTCQPRLPWRGDLRLSAREKALFREWAEAGAPEGQPAGAQALRIEAPPPAALEREDIVIHLPEPIVVEGEKDMHACVVIAPDLADDVYVVGRMVTPDNTKVLHHLLSYVIEPGYVDIEAEQPEPRTRKQLTAAFQETRGVKVGERYDCFGGVNVPGFTVSALDAWTPGSVPNIGAPNSAQFIDKDSLILLDIHYHPTGEPEIDSDSRLSLMLTDQRPDLISASFYLGNADKAREEYPEGVQILDKQPGETEAEFVVPADADKHIEDMSFKFTLKEDEEYRIYGLGTHMHYAGRDMSVRIEHPDGSEECLIQTPAWDFNWQRGYGYDADYEDLPTIKHGDTIYMHCEYDNTMQNRAVARALRERGLDEPVDVKLGEDTLDEMCVAGLSVLYPNPY